MRKLIFICIILFSVLTIINSKEYKMKFDYSTELKRPIGFAAVPQSEFIKVKNLNALTVQLPGPLSSSELQLALETAKSIGLTLIGRAEGRSKFQTEENKIDFDKLKNIINKVFSGTGIASDPDFLGYYIIDEPCHKNKWDITLDEFRQFYEIVKAVDSNIKIMVNFGYLECMENFIMEDPFGGRITDIAAFTITPKKLRKFPNYIANENAIAEKLKDFDPDLQIIPLIAVYEYPAMGESLPTEDWVREIGLKTLECNNFDGIMYYPWIPSYYMGDTIEDVADNPEYIKAFKDVFKIAIKKFGIKKKINRRRINYIENYLKLDFLDF
ncbi:hypothetical protein NLC36_02005 [Candidatus Aminicenantes bacterium AC-335-L06]|nr:hypothetical protein [Candidatus Aminicenantes bacterium AC-335-L06]